MVDDHFDFVRIENPVFAPGHQIVDGNGGGYLVAKNSIQRDDLDTVGRLVDPVGVEYFFCDGFTHMCLPFLLIRFR